MDKSSLLRMALVAASLSLGQYAWASGYQFDMQSARAQGSAGAGSAEAVEPSTIFYNPAGLTRLKGTLFSLDVIGVDPHSNFGYSEATNDLGHPVSPASTGGHYARHAVIPHTYASYRVDQSLVLGLGVFVPFGAKIDYGDDFAGRYYGSGIDFKSVAINPSLGYQLNERHSLGIGVSAQYLNVELKKAVDMVSTAFGVCLQEGYTPSDCGTATSAYIGQPDAKGSIKGRDWGIGFNLGYLFTPSEDTRIGLAYRSSIKHTLEGDANFSVPDGLPGGSASPLNAGIQMALANGKTSVELATPETISLAGYHRLTERWAIMGDVTWSRQSRLQNLEINIPTAQLPDRKSVSKFAWDDSWRASIGVNYYLNEQWILRCGYMYDQKPVSDSAYAMTILPDADRQMYAFGATYQINKHHRLDFAYTYLQLKTASVDKIDDDDDPSNGSPGTLKGYYHTHFNLFGLGYSYQF
ncbi:transporter [Vibrio fluvialis]|nr:transporter [Vibrio fluvialis]